MRESVNFQLIEIGFAYPCFYSKLAYHLRAAIKKAVSEVRKPEIELWSHDLTQQGVEWKGPNSISEIGPIFPKLWRRLRDYIRDPYFGKDAQNLDAFIEYLRLQEERDRIVSQRRSTTLDKIVTVDGNMLKMDHVPEDLVFT